jgi:predicted RNase H-like HicB family nuclease
MKTYSFRTIIEPDSPKGYHGFVPAVKGVHTCGKTIDEVKRNLKEAIRCHSEGLLKDKIPVPKDDLNISVDEFINLFKPPKK